jgi:hypothetical protein
MNPSGLSSNIAPSWEEIELKFGAELERCPILRTEVKNYYNALWDNLIGPPRPGEDRGLLINSVILRQRSEAMQSEQAED